MMRAYAVFLLTILSVAVFMDGVWAQEKTTTAAAPIAVIKEDPLFIYDPQGARDPLLPLVTAAGAVVAYEGEVNVTDMALEGIVVDGQSRVAILNGNIVEQGKMIGLYRVERIDADRVILLKDGQTSVLQLKKEE